MTACTRQPVLWTFLNRRRITIPSLYATLEAMNMLWKHGRIFVLPCHEMRSLLCLLCQSKVAGTAWVCYSVTLLFVVLTSPIVAMPTDPFTSNPPLRFRAVPDSLAEYHLEGSECCLIHADNPLSQTKGVYVNPTVRVGYNGLAYDAIHPLRAWVSLQNVALALWENRVRRWIPTQIFKKLAVRRRVASWESGDTGRFEPGEFCVINEMQVLAANGWAHV